MRSDMIVERETYGDHDHPAAEGPPPGPVVPQTPPEKPDTAPPEQNPPQEQPEIEPSAPGEDIPMPQFPEIQPPYE